MLADLQERRVGGAFDEIARGIDHEQARPLDADLAADQKETLERDALLLIGVGVDPPDLAHGAPDELGDARTSSAPVDAFDARALLCG